MKSVLLAAVSVLALTSFAEAKTPVTLWIHADRGGERPVREDQVARFQKEFPDIEVKIVLLPEGNYNDQVDAAAVSGGLPDIFETNGPAVANYAYSEFVRPLNDLIDPKVVADLLPSLIQQGTYPVDGKLYAIGTFDSGLGLWGNKSLLEKAGVRVPKGIDDAWTMAEFEDAMAKLAKVQGVQWPLDIKLNYGKGEWFTYGFAPIAQSMGGDLIDRKTWKTTGTLDGAATVAAFNKLKEWNAKGWIVPASAGDTAFYGEKKAALSLVGHWMYSQHDKGLGADAIVIPMPKFGDKHVTGTGSWNFAISTASKAPKEAAKLLEFMLRPEEIVKMTGVNGAVPGRKSAVALSDLYKDGGRLNLYYQQLLKIGVARPFHPVYPALSNAFAEAIGNTIAGADAAKELHNAAMRVDQQIAENGGYPPFGK